MSEADSNGNYHGSDGRFVSLRDYIESKLDDHEKLHGQLAQAVAVALASQDKRLDGMNEWRKSLDDFQSRSISRELFDQRATTVDTRLGTIERTLIGRDVFNREVETLEGKLDSLDAFRGKALGFGSLLALISGVIGALIGRAFS